EKRTGQARNEHGRNRNHGPVERRTHPPSTPRYRTRSGGRGSRKVQKPPAARKGCTGLMPTPLRSFRLDDERWDRLLFAAEDNNTTISAILRELIDEYLKENEQ